jgi:hypothetical protein
MEDFVNKVVSVITQDGRVIVVRPAAMQAPRAA